MVTEQDTLLRLLPNVMSEGYITDENSLNWWMIIALAELLLILFLVIRLQRFRRMDMLQMKGFDGLKQMKAQDIDMDNLMKSIHSSSTLYKELCKKCHPDRFQDDALKETAESLFQEISLYKRNYSKLSELKEQAINLLKVDFS